MEARDDMMTLLEKISNGKITADLPIFFEENKGQNIIFNSNLKFRHQF